LAAANQENHSDEAKRITAEINKVLAELDGMKAPAPANAPSAPAAKSSPAPNAAAMKPGKIRVIEVNGSGAKSVNAQGATSELKRGDFLSQGVRVVTGQNASVELAFENGSSVVVKPGSEFSIDQFLADPFDSQEVDYGSLENEPTMSVTRTNLKSGEIFFHVEKLKERSTYEIITPVGIAGIRGTGGFVRSGKGKGAFGLYEGSAIFKTPNGQVHSVRQGQAITVGDAATQYAVTGNPPKSAETLASAKEKMAEVDKETPAQPFEDEPLPEKEEKKADASEDSASADEYEGPVVTTLAGSGKKGFADGAGPQAKFVFPNGVAVDQSGNIFVADCGNHKIRKITLGGVVSTLVGSGKKGFADGTGSEAIFSHPTGLAVDEMGNIYIAEFSGNRVRKISPEGVVTTLAGSGKAGCADGTGVEATFNTLEGITVDSKGDIYVTDSKNHKIRKITPDGVVTTIAGSGNAGGADGAGAVASFNAPIGVAVDSGCNIYVCDTANHKIRKITPNGVVTTIAGTGKAGAEDGNSSVASFNRPLGITIDGIGNIYVAEEKNNKIRKITPNGFVSTLAGSGKAGAEDGYGATASFNIPFGVAVDQFGTLYVADAQNNKIRKIYQY
jgi:sugar lactone lactonase YvrE